MLEERTHAVYCLLPLGTANYTTERFTRNIDMSNYDECTFYVLRGGGTGAGTIFVESVPTTTGSSAQGTYIDGWHYQNLAASATNASTNSGDTFGGITAGTTAGFAIVTAGSYFVYEIGVPAAALSTAKAVRLDILMDSTGWSANAVAILSKPRYEQELQVSVIGDYTTL